MRSTLFISDSKNIYAKKISDILALLLGPGRSIDISFLSKDIRHYRNIVCTIYLDKNCAKDKELLFINNIKSILKDKKIVMLVILEEEVEIGEYKDNIIKKLGQNPDMLEFIVGKLEEKKLLKIAHNIAEKLNKNPRNIDNIVYILDKIRIE